jgi:hypothetical protein
MVKILNAGTGGGHHLQLLIVDEIDVERHDFLTFAR